MAEKHERSGRAAEDSSQPEVLGDWPNINLIMEDETGAVDYGYTPAALVGEEDGSDSAGEPAGVDKMWTFEVHTKLALDEDTFNKVREELKLRTKQGRQKAYRILRESAEFKRGKGAAKKMIKEALEAPTL